MQIRRQHSPKAGGGRVFGLLWSSLIQYWKWQRQISAESCGRKRWSDSEQQRTQNREIRDLRFCWGDRIRRKSARGELSPAATVRVRHDRAKFLRIQVSARNPQEISAVPESAENFCGILVSTQKTDRETTSDVRLAQRIQELKNSNTTKTGADFEVRARWGLRTSGPVRFRR